MLFRTTAFVFIIFSLVTFNASQIVNAQPKPERLYSKQKQLTNYFELAGVNELLHSVSAQLEQMHEQMSLDYGEHSVDAQIVAKLQSAWQLSQFLPQINQHIEKSLTPNQLSALMQWQQSQLAQKVKQLDQASESQEFQQAFIRFLDRLPADMPTQSKVQLINDIIDAKQVVDGMVELTIEVSRPVFIALLASPEAKKEGLTRAKIETQLQELEQLLEQDLARQVATLSYYLYKDLSVDELQRYADYYQSATGRLELEIQQKALSQSIALWQANYQQLDYNAMLITSPNASTEN